MGDGNLFNNKKKSDYIIRLDAIDEDFVRHFSKCVSKILSKNKSYAVTQLKHKNMDSIMYSTRARSKELFYFIKECKNDFEKTKMFVEKFPREFIQGLADSEGCPTVLANKNFKVGCIVACSVNELLLNFVCNLLEKEFLITSKVYLIHKLGKNDSIINGRIIKRKQNLFGLRLRTFCDVKKFSKLIGFNISRKQNKLLGGINLIENFSHKDRVQIWKKDYVKIGRGWEKLTN